MYRYVEIVWLRVAVNTWFEVTDAVVADIAKGTTIEQRRLQKISWITHCLWFVCVVLVGWLVGWLCVIVCDRLCVCVRERRYFIKGWWHKQGNGATLRNHWEGGLRPPPFAHSLARDTNITSNHTHTHTHTQLFLLFSLYSLAAHIQSITHTLMVTNLVLWKFALQMEQRIAGVSKARSRFHNFPGLCGDYGMPEDHRVVLRWQLEQERQGALPDLEERAGGGLCALVQLFPQSNQVAIPSSRILMDFLHFSKSRSGLGIHCCLLDVSSWHRIRWVVCVCTKGLRPKKPI